MHRLTAAWSAMTLRQRHAIFAAAGLLITMLLPWYSLQSVDRHTDTIQSASINAFGDVSFVEAAVFLVAAGVIVLLFARAEGRRFQMPGGDGLIVTIAGAWAALLIFYRVFSRPPGNGYPVGIEWGFFLAFIAAGALTYTGWRIKAAEAPLAPARRPERRAATAAAQAPEAAPAPRRTATPVAARPRSEEESGQLSLEEPQPRPRFPPAPPRPR
jgi:protein-S-isoprenylcysteine O-methyltransferase Ste14